MKNSATSTECPYGKAINAFSAAWKNAAKAYDRDVINSERCLQAFLYSELRKRLVGKDKNFQIYIEPKIIKSTIKSNIADEEEDDESYQKDSHIDTIIAYGEHVVLAVELKFNSRGRPKQEALKKDLASLSFMHEISTKVIIRRIYGKSINLSITGQTRIALGIFFAGDKKNRLTINDAFFGNNRPARRNNPTPRWLERMEGCEGGNGWRVRTLPYRFYVYGAKTFNKSESPGKRTEVVQICNQNSDRTFKIIDDK